MPRLQSLTLGLALVLGGSTSALADSDSMQVPVTVYSDDAVPDDCEPAYIKGVERFNEAIIKEVLTAGREQAAEFFHLEFANFSNQDPCRFYFSMGVFDAQGMLQQKVIMEFYLELHHAEAKMHRLEVIDAITREYDRRLSLTGMEAGLAYKLKKDQAGRTKARETFTKSMFDIAERESQAVNFGRFVFTSFRGHHPFTLFNYRRGDDGEILTSGNGDPLLETGSYQRLAENLYARTYQLAKEYMEWRPGLIYGEDAWMYGSFWRWLDPSLESPREIKERFYMNTATKMTNLARRYNLKVKPFLDVQQAMINKQRAVLERDIGMLDNLRYAVMAAPLVPVGMYIGAAGLAYAGVAAMPAGTSALSISGASLASAANISALISAGTIATYTGIGVYNAYQDYQSRQDDGVPFTFSDAMDHVVGAAVSSFPLAAALPAATGTIAAGGKYMLVSARSLIANGINAVKTARTLGFRGSLEALKGMPQKAFRAWLSAWWKDRTLITNYISGLSITIGFEVAYRQIAMEGEDKFIYYDNDGNMHINNAAMITIASSVIGGGIASPISNVKSIVGRTVLWQGVTIISSTLAQLALNQDVDWDRVAFDNGYGLLLGAPIGESERAIRLSSFVKGQPGWRQYVLLTAMKLSTKFLHTPIRAHLLKRYVDDDYSLSDDLRGLMLGSFGIDISDYSDDEIDAVVDELYMQEDFIEALLADDEHLDEAG